MSGKAAAKFERSCPSALAEIQHYRHEVEWRRAVGGYDLEALQWVETYCDNCTDALKEGDLVMLLVWHASLIKHLAWSRNPILKDEALRERNRAAAKPGELRSELKIRALEFWNSMERKPHNSVAFHNALGRHGIECSERQARDWYSTFR